MKRLLFQTILLIVLLAFPWRANAGDIKQVSAGWSHTMILKADGTLYGCGWNESGQLGDGTTTNRSTPVQVMTGVASVSAGYHHTMILKTDGSLWACGANGNGQQGDGTTTNHSTPVQVMTGVEAVSAGDCFTMILKTDGSLWSCGFNGDGQLGDGTTIQRKTPVQVMTGVAAVSAGMYHTMILKTNGTLWACGNNWSGRLGDGTQIHRSTPKQVMTGVAAVSAGMDHTMILKTNGTLWACGSNDENKLGVTGPDRLTPVQVMTGVAAVSAGGSQTMIIKTSEILYTCGSNTYGELGCGTDYPDQIPVQVMTGVESASGGRYHTMILKSNGTLWACGRNDYGQLGDGTYIDRYTPVSITLPSNVLVTSITLNKTSLSLETGKSETLTATVLPNSATNKSVTWTSSKTSVATVDSNGKVTAVAAGTATITCKANDGSGKQATCAVTVSTPGPVVESISLWWSTTVHLDGTKTLTPTITPSNATPTLTWTSSDTSVATVDQNGVVTGKKIGSATIRVTTDNGKSDWCIIKVVKVFTAQTAEGKTMTFQILSEDDKTCQAGEDYTVMNLVAYQVTTRAVPYGTTGQVTIPGTAGGYTVTGIGGLGFLNLRNITSVSIPNTVKDIGYAAFEGCTGIEAMTIPNSVTDIQSDAFSYCTNLKAVTLPNSVGRLSDYLFYGDVALTAIDIPSSVTEIGWRTFDETGLNEITIPSSVTKIESFAFANCTSLEKVTSMIAEPFEIDKSVFENTTDDVTSFTTATLYVPKGTRSVYQNTSAWNEFGSIIELGGGPDPGPDDFTDISQYANIVYSEAATASPESTLTLPVKMKNAQANISGFQFDLVLPAGVTVAKDEDDFLLIDLSTARTTTKKHIVTAQQQADGSIRVVCYSNNNSTFSGTSGDVLEMTLQVAANAAIGEQSIKLRDVVMTTPNLDSYEVPWVVTPFTIEDYMKGDVNGDKQVNVVDVAGVVNLILNSGNTSQLNRKAADINGDDVINVVDVAGVVNIILGNTAARTKTPTRADGQPLLYFNAYPVAQGQTITLPIMLDGKGDSFTGCQFDLYLPEGLSVAEEDGYPLVEIGSGTTTRKHVVSMTYQPDGALRVVCYSNNNSTFNDEEILTVAIHAAANAPIGSVLVALRNITLSRPDVTGVTLRDFDNELFITASDGIEDIAVTPASDAAPVFTLSGQRLAAPRKGVNIVDGKKVVVK